MDYIKLLDKVLVQLSQGDNDFPGYFKSPGFTDEENKSAYIAAIRLVKDGFAELVPRDTYGFGVHPAFRITFDGKLALDSAPKPFTNQPYAWKQKREQLTRIWSVVKILAVVVNSMAVLMFTYLTYKYKN